MPRGLALAKADRRSICVRAPQRVSKRADATWPRASLPNMKCTKVRRFDAAKRSAPVRGMIGVLAPRAFDRASGASFRSAKERRAAPPGVRPFLSQLRTAF